MPGENFENSARNSEFPLGWLIRICRGPDDDRLTLQKREVFVTSLAQRSRKNIGRVLLDKDVALECEPGRHLFVPLVQRVLHSIVIRCAFHDVAMCVSRVAVRASKGAADVRIYRPEAHAGDFGTVENVFREGRVIADVFLLADDWEEA